MIIDEIVLLNDKRGISQLKDYVESNSYRKAAEFALGNLGTVFITTGFFVKGFIETDGPPGTIVLARALKDIGFAVFFVTDSSCKNLLKSVFGNEFEVINFPILDSLESKKFAKQLLEIYKPELVISLERCGLTKNNQHKNMRGVDISEQTAKVDYLFIDQLASIGIGDGGNEIGMGNLYQEIKNVPSLVSDPSSIKTTKLLIASVSNWGGYGLTTALSEMMNRNLLPSNKEIWEIVRSVVDAGGVDGISGEHIYRVDGFSDDIDGEIVDFLHDYLDSRLIII
jgi:hypothetical protein